jgi:RNA polymerase sigma-70 factor, ECF subfamily
LIQRNHSHVLYGMQLVLSQPRGMLALMMGPGMAGTPRAWLGPRHSALMPTDEEAAAAAGWGRLIQAVATRQDRAAFVMLFEHFAPRIKTFMLRSGAREATAEEIAQETMLAVWRKADSFVPGSTGAPAWIFTIARNLRIDALRREKREIPGKLDIDKDDAAEPQIDERPTPESQVATVQLEQCVRRAIAQLSNEQLRVIELSFFEDKPHGEIAELLRIPLGTVKSRLRLAVARLRALLGDMS